MNEFTLTQLKILVERAIRPVRASIDCKQKMREELLAHVVGVFEEEAKLGDEQSALARTQERFGQPAELTSQLQASVPEVDRIHRFVENLSGDSALRLAGSLAALIGAGSFIPFGITILTHGRVPSLLHLLWIASFVFCATLLTLAMRQALLGPAGPSWLRVGLVAVATWLIIPVTAYAVGLTEMADLQKSLRTVVPLLPHGLLAPVVLVVLVYMLWGFKYRQDQDWAHLDID